MTTEKKELKAIFIGGKPFINYVTGVTIQFNKGTDKVVIKARGKFISKGVDVAEIMRKKSAKKEKILVENVLIGSEEFKNKENKLTKVSTIEITLKKKIS